MTLIANQKDLKPLITRGVKGFKCFLIESGVEVRVTVLADGRSLTCG